jgi:hypothetical protein
VPDRCIDAMSGPPRWQAVGACALIEESQPGVHVKDEWGPAFTGWCQVRIWPDKIPSAVTVCEINEAVEGPASCWQE